jgi:hypothetical protein
VHHQGQPPAHQAGQLLGQAAPLGRIQQDALAGGAEHEQAGGAAPDLELDQLGERPGVGGAVGVERGDQRAQDPGGRLHRPT